MYIREALVIAFHSMRVAPLRMVLTMVGVIIGITAVVVLVGFGDGARKNFNDSFAPLNTSLFISKTAANVPGGNAAVPLRESDVDALSRPGAAPNVAQVAPLRNGSAVARLGDREYAVSVGGTYPAYLQARNRTLLAGRMFTDEENHDRVRVVVLGTRVINRLFDGDVNQALGSEVRLGRLSMRVIGVLNPAGDDQDNLAVVPLNSSRPLFGGADNVNMIGAIATGVDTVPAAIADINRVLDDRHNVKDPVSGTTTSPRRSPS
ncbi:MAG TPA: ABC transporter permease [Pseudonocardia sp.]|jgi:putative ABC transport system permease protein